jgi:cell division protein ZipA
MGLRELVILVLILAIVGVILRGLYVALKARRGQLRMALEKNIPQHDPEELSLSELPNGGARMVERSFAEVVRQNSEISSRDRLHKGRSEQAIPVLMDTITDDDDVGSARTPPSAVAGARQAARQRHGLKPGFARPPQKPTHRPIDRMAERPQIAAAAATAVAQPALFETPVQPALQSDYADPLDSHVFRAEEVEESRYDAPAFENPSLAAATADDDYDDVEQRYEAQEYDYDDELEDDEELSEFEEEAQADAENNLDDDDTESFENVYADDADDYDDDLEADDEELDDPLASRFEDELDDEEDDAEEIGDEAEEYHYETDFADERDANDQESDDNYEDDEEDEVVEQKTGPRRWLQWAGEKLSGMTAAAASEGERDREKAAEEQARARAEMNERAAKAASNAASKANNKADNKAERRGRTERAEPVFGAASFDDALLDDDQDYHDHRSFSEPARGELNAQSRARPAATETVAQRKQLEPLDRSRQSELNLDAPEELGARLKAEPRTESRAESRAESKPESRAESKKASREPVKEPSKKAPRHERAEADAVPEYSEVLVINVVAKPEREFSGVDLLPVLLTSELRFGDMSIFHRHIDADSRSPVLFSVANIVNPGTFDLNQINDFATRGLCFFMTLPNVANSMQAFDKMLDVAQQVRITLDGDLKDDNRSVMTAQTIEHYRQRVRDFDLRQLRQHK